MIIIIKYIKIIIIIITIVVNKYVYKVIRKCTYDIKNVSHCNRMDQITTMSCILGFPGTYALPSNLWVEELP